MRADRIARLAAVFAVAALSLGSVAARAVGPARDSDDLNCMHGSLDDPRTIEACSHLRGAPVTVEDVASWREQGFQRANADWVCHHGRKGAWRTREACRRLSGDSEPSHMF